MNLHCNRDGWHVGATRIHCGQQVQIRLLAVGGAEFWVWGRFEISGNNNPVFELGVGEFRPDLQSTEFRLP